VGTNGVDPAVILLVEDNPDDVELTRIAMSDAGIDAELAVVADGREALSFLRQEPPFVGAARPDLVLLDLNLPQLDGRELLRIVKADPALSSIPIVVLTTSVDDNDVVEAYKAHANSFISKPADFGSYVDTLRTLGEFWFGVAVLPIRR
jgi:chemotaxis family two-component system response regulator Rcp1